MRVAGGLDRDYVVYLVSEMHPFRAADRPACL